MKDNTPPWEVWSQEAMLELLCGNLEAARFMGLIANISHVYDDLIDKDKPLTDEVIHEVFWQLLVDLPINPFYRANLATLQPVIAASLLNFRAANAMEQSNCLEQLRISHVIRYSGCDLLLLCMLIAGGPKHAAQHAARARLLCQCDTWAHYRSEHYK